MNWTVVLVSTEGGRGEREQEREREDPEISSGSVGYTATSGLGTEGINAVCTGSNQYTSIAYSGHIHIWRCNCSHVDQWTVL